MGPGLKLDQTPLKDLSAALHDLSGELDESARRIEGKTAGAKHRILREKDELGGGGVRRETPLERHTLQWARYVREQQAPPDEKAIRFLCWVPEIATDSVFLTYLVRSGIEMRRRTFAGLVRSCHSMWEDMPRTGPSVRLVAALLGRYSGSDRLLIKWRANIPALLAADAPRVMAEKLVTGGSGFKSFIDAWRIEPQSAFFRKVVECAAAACRARLHRLDRGLTILLFRDLLPWCGWDPAARKKEIGALILHEPMSIRSREIVQRFVLHFEELGDPRTDSGNVRWSGVPRPAKERMIDWLSSEIPYAFHEHVYQQGEGWVWKRTPSLQDPLSFEDAVGK